MCVCVCLCVWYILYDRLVHAKKYTPLEYGLIGKLEAAGKNI